ncbi:MAG: thioesterase [Eubacteriales bacterium]|nr:thioesterase [Eubacteriales bacterium]MDY3332303.1 thioesterase [Gallibacter sp.]
MTNSIVETISADGIISKAFSIAQNTNAEYIVALVKSLEHMGTYHSDLAGYNTNYLVNNNRGWVLLGWHITFKQYNSPHQDNSINIDTWTHPFRRMQMDRHFIINDSKKVIANATSRWIYFDTNRRRPIKPTAEMLDDFIICNKPAPLDEQSYKPIDFSDYALLHKSTVTSVEEDIDINKHTNNVSYIRWALEAIDQFFKNTYSNYNNTLSINCNKQLDLKELHAIYIKETMLGDTVNIKLYKKTEKNSSLSLIVNFTDSFNNILCQVQLQL